LAQLPKGTTVEAQVVNGLDNGNVRLQVAVGETVTSVEAKLPAALPSGTNLTLRVQQVGQAGDTVAMRLTAVNGKPLVLGGLAHHDPALALRNVTQAGVLTGQATQAAQGVSSATGQNIPPASAGTESLGATSTIGVGKPISALVLRNDLMKGDADKADIMNTGTRLTVRLTRIAMPDIAGVPNRNVSGKLASGQGAQLGGGQSPSAPAAPVGQFASGVVSGGGATVVPGQAAAKYAAMGQFSPSGGLASSSGTTIQQSAGAGQAANQVSPQVSSTGSGVPSANPAAGPAVSVLSSLRGTVVGHSAVGQPTVQTSNSLIALDIRAPLPAGTQINFDVLTATPPQPGATAAIVGGGFAATSQVNPWTTLDALWQTASQTNPQTAARLASALPQPGAHMLANLVASMGALRSGDVQNWLKLAGDPQDDDRSGGRIKKLVDRLTDDVREAGQSARRPVGEWRAYSLPFFANGEIDKIQMVVRRAPDQEDDEARQEQRSRAKHDVRFLMDISLSRLGEMQLDGLVNNVAKSFDLVIRTHDSLPEGMTKDILGVFNSSLSAVGYTGSLNFRVTSDFVIPEDVISAGNNNASGVEV